MSKRVANLQTVSIKQAAELMKVSERTIYYAREVIEHGSPELIQMVEAGLLAVSKAAFIALNFPKEQQVAEARKPKRKPTAEHKQQLADEKWVSDFLKAKSRKRRLALLAKHIKREEWIVLKDKMEGMEQ